ncbi:MAG: DUF4835 family protein [Chitinophagaceae bacterium]
MYKPIFIICLLLAGLTNNAQELRAKVTVISNRVSSQTDKKIFQTLQTALNNFLNNRKWTNDAFQPQERIECNFLINIDQALENNAFKASLTVQAARPVYNSAYLSPLVNYLDNSLTFRYAQFTPLEFNENRIQGSDPLASNLTATLAYYVYIILGMDYNSFSLKGGDVYFQKAQNVVNNAPESRDITGWKAFDGMRNRYWLTENLLSARYTLVHDAMYDYFRNGFDKLYTAAPEGRKGILEALNKLNQVNTEQPNSMILQFFMQGRSDELIRLYSKAPPDEKNRARDLLQKIDIANGPKYQQELK